MRKKHVTLLSLLLCSMIMLATLCGSFVTAVPLAVVSATSAGAHKFDSVNVLDDLQSNADFDINDYKFDENGKLEVINFVEYCYSFRQALSSNFALYVYVYNPALIEFNFESASNKITMAHKYNDNGEPADYKKFNLVLCNTAEGDYAGLFYKLRVDFTADEQAALFERLGDFNQAERRYDLSEVELMPVGAKNPESINISWTVTATGFAKGYGADLSADSTLQVKIEGLDTIEFDINHTYYRQYKGDDKFTQLNTVYFAVDEKYFEMYGTLQRIKAEWYEYKTKDVLAMSNKDLYDAIYPYLGQEVINNEELGKTLVNSQWLPGNSGFLGVYSWAYNTLEKERDSPWWQNVASVLYLMLPVNSVEENVTSKMLQDEIYAYDKTYNSGTLPIKNRTISADLFQDDIDSNRKIDNEFGKIEKGYSYYDFDYGAELMHLDEYNPFWIDALFGDKKIEEKNLNIIYEIKSGDLVGSDQEISDSLCIAEKDVNALKAFYAESALNNQRVILFRFATSEYRSLSVDAFDLHAPESPNGILGSWERNVGYVATQTVFLDFDIIQLTFKRDDIYKVIPVVARPIDVVSDLTPPYQAPGIDWWAIIKKILLWAAVILLVIIFGPSIINAIFKEEK